MNYQTWFQPDLRFFSSCVGAIVREKSLSGVETINTNVYLFGGTDGTENFGDLWILRGHADSSEMMWERQIAVGAPPCPRYGHRFVSVSADGSVLAVLGGCYVSAQSEMVGGNINPTQHKMLQEQANNLQNRYEDENAYARVGGDSLNASVQGLSDVMNNAIDGVFRQASGISNTFYSLELETRAAEKALVDSFHLSKATSNMNIQRARHPEPHMDVTFLHTKELLWQTHVHPKIKGEIPVSRIHFGAVAIGDYIIVMGGCEPTNMRYDHIEKELTKVYALDLKKWRWLQPIPIKSSDYLKDSIRIADADVIRAKKKVKDEANRGRMAGATNGKTVECVEAETVLEVCYWRKDVLLQEQKAFTSPPVPRFGAALTLTGQRVVYLGGWTPYEAVPFGDVKVLNLEKEEARTRRLADEHQAKLAREIASKNFVSFIDEAQKTHERALKIKAERHAEAREIKQMVFEDFLSGLPSLYKPEPVRLVKANAHTMWVQWDAVKTNSKNEPITEPDKITYYLYMKVGFQNFLVGDRVSVVCRLKESQMKDKKNNKKHKSHVIVGQQKGSADRKEGLFFDSNANRFDGEVLKVHGNGSFDVLFDDGITEKNIKRLRMKLVPSDTISSSSSSSLSSSSSSSSSKLDSPESRSQSALAVTVSASTLDVADKNHDAATVVAAADAPPSFLSPLVKRRKQRQAQQHERHLLKVEQLALLTDRREDEELRKYNEYLSRNSMRTTSLTDSTGLHRGIPSHMASKKKEDYDVDAFFASCADEEEYCGDRMAYSPSKAQTVAVAAAKRPCSSVPTVKPHRDWQLVFVGTNVTQYTCAGIVALDAISNENRLIVPAAFAVQVHGTDFPAYERSQLSDTAIFYTKPERLGEAPQPANRLPSLGTIAAATKLGVDTSSTSVRGGGGHEGDVSPLASPSESSIAPSSTAKHTQAIRAEPGQGNEEEEGTVTSLVSKTKKTLFSAVINGSQMVHIERRNFSFVSSGVSDDYI